MKWTRNDTMTLLVLIVVVVRAVITALGGSGPCPLP